MYPRMEGGGEQGVGVVQRPLPGEVGGGDGIGPVETISRKVAWVMACLAILKMSRAVV